MKTTISVRCRLCCSVHKIVVDKERYNRWFNGEGLIQNMLPDNTAEERELLLSGICGDCWDGEMNAEEELMEIYNDYYDKN